MKEKDMYKLLILDDEVLSLRMLEKLIEKELPELDCVAACTSVQEALGQIRALAPDILLTDIRMPEYSGLDLIKILRKEKNEIEVVVMSAYADFSYAQEALRLACCGYIVKPIDEFELGERLRAAMCNCDKRRADFLAELPPQLVAAEHWSRPVKQAHAWILQNYRESFSLEQLSEAVNLSKTYLSSLFKKETGETIWDFLLRVRMEKARALIKEERAYNYEISAQVGFDDPNYFSRKFRQFYGTSPNEYRCALEKARETQKS